jgi:hypothetical protein
MAYVAPPGPSESIKAFKRRLYRVLLTMVNTSTETSELRIISKYPELTWPHIWANLHAAGLSDTIKSTWYAAIRDIIPTDERVASIYLVTVVTCLRCGATDTATQLRSVNRAPCYGIGQELELQLYSACIPNIY